MTPHMCAPFIYHFVAPSSPDWGSRALVWLCAVRTGSVANAMALDFTMAMFVIVTNIARRSSTSTFLYPQFMWLGVGDYKEKTTHAIFVLAQLLAPWSFIFHEQRQLIPVFLSSATKWEKWGKLSSFLNSTGFE